MEGVIRSGPRVLDLGCGVMKWAQFLTPDQTYVGIDLDQLLFPNWPRRVRANDKVTRIEGDIIDFERLYEGTPDVVLLMDVIEHLDKQAGRDLLDRLVLCYPRATIAVFTPDGFHPNPGYDDPDDLQFHRSGWTVEDFDSTWTTHTWPQFHETSGAILAVRR